MILDRELLDALSDGDKEFTRDLFDTFLKSGRQHMVLIDRGVESGDTSSFVTEVHALKGASASLGLVQLSDLAAEIERAAKGGDIELCRQNRQALNEAFAAAEQALRRYLREGFD